jgi:hypothetical protein
VGKEYFFMSTIRFRELVKTSGKPATKSLWTDPKRDRQFSKAVEQKRVLTILPGPGSHKKEFGQIGFRRLPHANYLVFPRPLPSEGSKVIGIKYDLVEEPAPRDAVPFAELERAPKTRERSGRKSQTSAEKKPVEKIFHLAARTVAVIETKLELKARNRNDAKSKAHELVKGQGFDPAKARFTTRIKILGDR